MSEAGEKEDAETTPERAARGCVVVLAREATDGGGVKSEGQVDAFHTYMDFLYEADLLGREPQASRRRDDANRFYELRVKTQKSEKSNARDIGTVKGQAGENPVHAAEVGDITSVRQQQWLRTTRYLARHFKVLEDYVLTRRPPDAPVSLSDISKLAIEAEAANAAVDAAMETADTATFRRLTEDLQRKTDRVTRAKAMRAVQLGIIHTHRTSFSLARHLVFDALDALSDAMERAENEGRADAKRAHKAWQET